MPAATNHPLRLGLVREGKVPPDSRVALTPEQAAAVTSDPRYDLAVQPAPGRCFSDADYLAAGVTVAEDLRDRDVLIGIKEVRTEDLIPGKTYLFFSHTHKCQAYNRDLLRAIVERGIRLIDYELLTDATGARLIAFGGFAGMVGAHHGLRAWGLRTGRYTLPQMSALPDYAAARAAYAKTDFGDLRVVATGTGRVGAGAARVLADAGLRRVSAADFRAGIGAGQAVFTQLASADYLRPRDGGAFDRVGFRRDPSGYRADFLPYARQADVLVHGIFWDNAAPAMFTVAEAAAPGFRIAVIADVTCDIAPVTSIPATLRPSTSADPYFGFERASGRETDAWHPGAITMCTIDNLPNELARDASAAFGTMLIETILPELLDADSAILERATIARDGAIAPRFEYLKAFVAGGD